MGSAGLKKKKEILDFCFLMISFNAHEPTQPGHLRFWWTAHAHYTLCKPAHVQWNHPLSMNSGTLLTIKNKCQGINNCGVICY